MSEQKKIIHIDMDCFYAAVEIRDNPTLANKPVGVGGSADRRGVLCTCNYIARQYGIRSAMPTAYAHRLCKELIVLPVNINKYREVAQQVHAIFHQFTPLVEPLSLDEAYLDVSNSPYFNGSATLIAQEIRRHIAAELKLTASAGVAPNKFLAKIASAWNKPDGLFVIRPHEVSSFVKELPLGKLFGVGKVTAKKLDNLGYKVCSDLYNLTLMDLTYQFGKFGKQLYEQSRGIDHRLVEPNRIRKSLSVESTFSQDINSEAACRDAINTLYIRLNKRFDEAKIDLAIKSIFIKVKYSNFKQITMERACSAPGSHHYYNLFQEIRLDINLAIRLLGLGMHFKMNDELPRAIQLALI